MKFMIRASNASTIRCKETGDTYCVPSVYTVIPSVLPYSE